MTSKLMSSLRRSERMLLLSGVGAVIARRNRDNRGQQRMREASVNIACKIINIISVDIPEQVRAPRISRTIDSFSDAECYRRFRFRKPDLRQLFNLLQFPETIRLANRSRYTGEEVFLFGLNRFTSCAFVEDLIAIFGGEISQWSRAFHYFIE